MQYCMSNNEEKFMKKNSTLKYAFLASLPVMAGYLVLGMGFGILLQDKGYGWWWALLMSSTIYAGSMQYVGVDLLAGGASMLATALMTIMVNIRHLFYGISMLGRYQDTGKSKPYLIFALTDETYSLVCAPEIPEGVDEKKYYLYVSALNQCYWIVGSVVGALAGSVLPFDSTGIDFAMTVLFVVIFVEQWEKADSHLPAITGVAVSVICRVIFGADSFLIPAMIGITVMLFVEKHWIKLDDNLVKTEKTAKNTENNTLNTDDKKYAKKQKGARS